MNSMTSDKLKSRDLKRPPCKTQNFWVYLSLCSFFFLLREQVIAQSTPENIGNMRLAEAGGGAASLSGSSTELLPMVMQNTSLSSGDGRENFQLGIISSLPSYIQTASTQYRGEYMRKTDSKGQTYNTGAGFQSTKVPLAQSLTVDPENMVLDSSSWFYYKGIIGSKPPIRVGFGYDTNQSNTFEEQSAPVITQTTSTSIPFAYGIAPGSSWLVLVSYEPSYRMTLLGNGENELNHRANFSAARQFDASAYGINNTTSYSSLPIRELSGRQRIFSNKTTLLTAHSLSPKSLIHTGLGHSFSTRDTGVPNSNVQPLILDEAFLRYHYNFKPRLTLGPDLRVGMITFDEAQTFTESAQLTANYNLAAKTAISASGGIQWQQAADRPGETTKSFGLVIAYLPTPKTTMEFGLSRSIRPSFANEGIFLTEDSIHFELEKAILLRWLLRLDFDYTRRSQAVSGPESALEQNDFGIGAQVSYYWSNRTILDFGFSRFRLNDLIKDSQSTRLSIQCSIRHAF